MKNLMTTMVIFIGLSTSAFAEFDPRSDGPAGWLQNHTVVSENIKLAQNSYSENTVPYPFEQRATHQNSKMRSPNTLEWPKAIAASILFFIGLSSGWFANSLSQNSNTTLPNITVSQVSIKNSDSIKVSNIDEPRKYMLHMNLFDNDSTNKTFRETEAILTSYANSGLPIKLDVLIDQEGVQLFNTENTKQLKRIRNLINAHDNLDFYACSKSLQLFMDGIRQPDDFGEVHTDQIVEELLPERIKEGWVYIKV